ncbi:MAG: sensor histidine kinase [Bryobacteraceae bacterium]|nr:sensor histidine kinase [Bryobacteraceae bacterium]
MQSNLTDKTWIVFLMGLGSLLALLFVPGTAALRRTEQVYREVRAIQQSRESAERRIAEIQRHLYVVSLRVREFLLDTSPDASDRYRSTVVESRSRIEGQIEGLGGQKLGPDAADALRSLEAQLAEYWPAVESVFAWTPQDRAARATYFLRQQQRPRRENIIAIASELTRLTDASYQDQFKQVDQSQLSFRRDIERTSAAAMLIGLVIAGGTALRIATLENRSRTQSMETEQAEERLRHLSTQLMRAQEEERRSISRELHDEVGQMLTGLRIELGALERLRTSETFDQHLNETKSLAEQTLRAVRNLAVGLRPSVLDLGLAPALQSQARDFSRRSGVRAHFSVEGDVENVPDEYRTCIYRLVQESLTNCMRHASAQSVDIRLRERGGVLNLEIRDDGQGFDLAAERNGTGLLGMQERVRELGGRLEIVTQAGQGTALRVTLAMSS